MTSLKHIKKVFIANRGEIARRIAHTCKKLGVATVAIREQTGVAKSPPPEFLKTLIDEWVIVEEESTNLYLDMDFLIEAAIKHGCDAVHPGFGFLSENAEFAKRVDSSGLIWIGPPSSAITSMASKSEACRVAEQSGVPTVPGIRDVEVPQNESGDFSRLIEFAKSAGFPLLMKAAYGGGGKGMRLVESMDQLTPAALRAASEAKASFGNPSLLCERYIRRARHIEVQVLADKDGCVKILSDRDCSAQRRHQKVFEEAPAPLLDDELRSQMHESARSLAEKVGYVSAGTVEYIAEWDDTSKKVTQFYFLEMNTRLQVEHPVTEEIMGLDLVEWQLRIANGESIQHLSETPLPRHSIEARIYSENTENDFFPSPGPVRAFIPYQTQGLRWEIGMDGIDRVSERFDPMVAKLIATAETRSEAIALLKEGLTKTHLVAESSNIPFLVQHLGHEVFANAHTTTHFIKENLEALNTPIRKKCKGLRGILGALANELEGHAPAHNYGVNAPDTLSVFRKKPTSYDAKQLIYRGTNGTLHQLTSSNCPELSIAASSFPGGFCLHGIWAHREATLHSRSESLAQYAAESIAEGGLVAPVPGKVVSVLTSAGAEVKKDQTLFILESMKMEFEVKASLEGVIADITVAEGQQVDSGQVLATLE